MTSPDAPLHLASPDILAGHLAALYAPDTAQDPARWNPERPSTGHCAVVALLVQDVFGGDLIRATGVNADGPVVHYWTKTPDYGPLDLTADQFVGGAVFERFEVRARDRLLADPDTRARYARLKARLHARLASAS